MLIRVCYNLPNFRVLREKLGVTLHAFSDRRNSSFGARISTGMAIEAIQAELYVLVVRKRHGLSSQTSYEA